MFGFGMDTSSSTAQASPFFNNAGINFGGDMGGIEASGDFGAGATAAAGASTPTRQTAGGLSPITTESYASGVSGGSPLWPYILAAVLVGVGLIWYFFKK